MQFLRNLPLAARLGLGFGALTLGLAIVAAVAFSAVGSLKSDVEEIADDVTIVDLVGNLGERAEQNGHLAAQHLYVHHGDLEAQDRVARRIEQLKAANSRDTEKVAALAAGSMAGELAEAFAGARADYLASLDEAIKRSRQETVDGVEDRDGSRDFYTRGVLPRLERAHRATEALTAEVAREVESGVSENVAAAGASRRAILLAGVLSLLLAGGVAVWITRSVTRPVRRIGARLRSLDEHCVTSLRAGLERVAEGDLTHEVVAGTTPVEVEGRDELGRLSETFNGMLAKVEGGIDSYNQMRAGLSSTIN
ncbi:MAG: HAMP domain-containing protein, partial [Gaiellaceae bacterium]